jgi:hypothetical protein
VRKDSGKTLSGAELLRVGRKARSDWNGGREKPLSDEDVVPVPQTDTGRKVEKTQAHGRTLVKELGNIAA